MEFCWIHEGNSVVDFNSKDFNLNRFLKSKNNKKAVITLLAIGLIVCNNSLALAQGTGVAGIDKLGSKFLMYAQQFGKWVFLVLACINVIKESMEGANKDVILKTVLKYLIAFACLHALPAIFGIVEESFAEF